MFKFAKIEDCNGFKYDWMYYIDSVESLQYYHENVLKQEFKTTLADLIESSSRKFLGHCNTKIGGVFHNHCRITGNSVIGGFLDLSNKILSGQLELLLKYGSIAINHNLGYFPINKNFEIVEVVESEMIPLKYTVVDIKISSFAFGKHFYCKIKNIDVVDDFGNQKWNTYDAAYNAGVKYLENNY